jgi:predicted PurR-regulated permease PerM
MGDMAALSWLTVALCLGAFRALTPLWVPIVLAGWSAIILLPLQRGLAKRLHGRRGAAAVLTVLLVIVCLAPLSIALFSLSASAIDLAHRLLRSNTGTEALRSLAFDRQGAPIELDQLSARQLLDVARQHGESAIGLARSLFGAASVIVVALVVFVAAFHTFLLHGEELCGWLLEHSPLERSQSHRLFNVFAEVGRGLLIGLGFAGLLQATVATIGYAACGVPQPLVLGVVTLFASLIPSVGSGLVWAPVTLGLLLVGRPGAALAMLIVGCVASVTDNVIRPLLTKYGQLRMHGLLTFAAMLGGIAAFGASGLLLGPLLVRAAAECLTMLRESKLPAANRA